MESIKTKVEWAAGIYRRNLPGLCHGAVAGPNWFLASLHSYRKTCWRCHSQLDHSPLMAWAFALSANTRGTLLVLLSSTLGQMQMFPLEEKSLECCRMTLRPLSMNSCLPASSKPTELAEPTLLMARIGRRRISLNRFWQRENRVGACTRGPTVVP